MIQRPLYLHEEVLLLALRDKAGTMHSGAWVQSALGGALLGELFLGDFIRSNKNGKKDEVVAVSAPSSGDELLDRSYAAVESDKKRHSPATWAARFGASSDLLPKAAQELIRHGVLRLDEKKVLLLFKRKVYPEVDPRPEAELTERLRAAIFDGASAVDPRTTVLVAVAHRTGLLKTNFDPKEVDARKERIEGIVRGDFAGDATKQAVETTQAAFFVATMVPIFIST